MKPTLDEEISEIAERCATDYTDMSDFSSLPECIAFAIYAGIEAWKRQEKFIYACCLKHKGMAWAMEVTYTAPMREVCPICEPPMSASLTRS